MPKMTQLTGKQRNFARQYVKNNFNGPEAALKSYNTKSRVAARTISYGNLHKPEIQQEITSVLRRNGMDEDYIARKLNQALESGIGVKATNSDALRSIENIIKLYGYTPVSKHANLNVTLSDSYNDKKHSELIEELKKSTASTQKLLKDLGDK